MKCLSIQRTCMNEWNVSVSKEHIWMNEMSQYPGYKGQQGMQQTINKFLINIARSKRVSIGDLIVLAFGIYSWDSPIN